MRETCSLETSFARGLEDGWEESNTGQQTPAAIRSGGAWSWTKSGISGGEREEGGNENVLRRSAWSLPTGGMVERKASKRTPLSVTWQTCGVIGKRDSEYSKRRWQ